MDKTMNEIIPVLQVAIIPVIMISGVALLLLTITNRFGRVSDRARLLAGENRKAPEYERHGLQPQIAALFRRARFLRAAATLASLSALLDAVLVITLFGAALYGLEVAVLISVIFVGSMGALAGSVIAFLLDLNLSLVALRLDVVSEAILRTGELNGPIRCRSDAPAQRSAGNSE